MKEFVGVIDSRKTTSQQKIFSEHFLPHLFDRFHFSKETVATDVEAITFVVYGSGNTSDDVVFFQHHRPDSGFTEFVRCSQSCGACADDHYRLVVVNVLQQGSSGESNVIKKSI